MTDPLPPKPTAAYVARLLCAVLYVFMAGWLIFGGGRRVLLQLAGKAAPDYAGYTSVSLGVAALVLFLVALVLTRRARHRLRKALA